MADTPIDPQDFIQLSNKDYYGCPPLTDAMIRSAEEHLGYRLPKSYLDLLRAKNGFYLKLERSCCPAPEPTSFGEDYLDVDGILGLGGPRGADSDRGTRHMVAEWKYPDIGVVFGASSSGGHAGFMFDYTACGPQGEPRVVFVIAPEVGGESPRIIPLAPDFPAFLRTLAGPDDF